MSGGSGTTTRDATDSARPIEFAWEAHPARERTLMAALGLLIIMAVGAIVTITLAIEGVEQTRSILAGAASMGFLVYACGRFYFPSRCRIDAEGISAESFMRSKRLCWREIRRFVHDARGGFLSRRSVPTRMDVFTGMHLVFDPASREEAVRAIRARLPEGARVRAVASKAESLNESPIVERGRDEAPEAR